MLDLHFIPNENWGFRPILFNLGNFPIPSYSFFMLLAIVVACFVYWKEAKKTKSNNQNTFYLLISALIAGAIGAKIPIVLLYWKQIFSGLGFEILVSGRSIMGGLIGGTIGVLYMKHRLKIKVRRGNIFAPAVALGMAIGRIGCFLRGCCFGKETWLPWAVDFGNGILRHPTQLYESLFMFCMFFYLNWKKKQNPKPGELFDKLIAGYFIFRFFIEFIRVEKIIFFGLTFFQILCLLGLIWIYRHKILSFFKKL